MNMHRSSRGLVALLLISLFAIPFAGCSSKTANAGAAESVRQASERSAKYESVAFEMNVSMDGMQGFDLDTTSEGAYDVKARQMHMTLSVMGQDMEAVLDGPTMYLKTALLGDQWVKQDLEADAFAGTGGLAEDPTKVLEWLAAAGDDVSDAGSDTIRGETARHYRVELDLREAADRLDGDQREKLEQALEALGTDTMPVDLWINSDGLPVRIRYEMSFANSDVKALKNAKTTFAIDFFDWGKPVSVVVPDPDDVQDASGVLGGLLED